MPDGGRGEQLLLEARACLVRVAADEVRPAQVADRNRLAELIADALRQLQAPLELRHGVLNPPAGEPDPAEHDPDHRPAVGVVEPVGELECSPVVRLCGIEVRWCLGELRGREGRESQ
jgi:hypothetical protein